MHSNTLSHISSCKNHHINTQGTFIITVIYISSFTLSFDHCQLLTSVLLAPGGQVKILQAFDYLRTVAEENKRFQTLILSLTDIPVNSAYQVSVLST